MRLRFVPNAWADEDDAEDAERAERIASGEIDPPAPLPGLAWRLAHLRVLLPTAAAMLLVAGVAGGMTRGVDGAAGAVSGVALVVFSYLLTTVFLAWVDTAAPALIFPMGMTLYVTKFGLFGMIMYLVANAGWAGLAPMAIGICFGVFGWTGVHIWWLHRGQRRGALAVS
ncbi:hypothetical protein [Pilimelia columellifera]|uniref:ATP synthase protein I n=1 Tax=Pilimelia columellifera subsp. columellifera TaxID=706583 RepID=A0ABN3NHX4_9ACTN